MFRENDPYVLILFQKGLGSVCMSMVLSASGVRLGILQNLACALYLQQPLPRYRFCQLDEGMVPWSAGLTGNWFCIPS